MVGKRTADVVRKLRNARFTPPNGGPKEKLRWINDGEADLLRTIGGSGRRGKFGFESYSWRDDSGSDTNGTQDGNGGSMDGSGNVSGTGSGSGGGGMQTGSTGAFAPRAPIAPVRPTLIAPPIPRVKPPVPTPFLGPNTGMINTLPQIGGTNYADMMTAAINAGQAQVAGGGFSPGSSYGAPGGADNPANDDTGDGGDGITSMGQTGPGKFGPTSTQTLGPSRPIGTTPATMQRQPFSTYVRSPYKNPATYTQPGKIPDRNPFMEPEHPVIANTPSTLAQYGPIDAWKAAAALAARRKAITDRIPATSGNFRPGSVFSPDRSQPRSPDPRDQRAY